MPKERERGKKASEADVEQKKESYIRMSFLLLHLPSSVVKDGEKEEEKKQWLERGYVVLSSSSLRCSRKRSGKNVMNGESLPSFLT